MPSNSVFGYTKTAKATQSKTRGPTPVKSKKTPADYQSSKVETKNPNKPVYISKVRDYSDSESKADSDETVVDVATFFVANDDNYSHMAPRNSGGRDRDSYGRPDRERPSKEDLHRQGPTRNQPTRVPDDTDELFNPEHPGEAAPHIDNSYFRENPPFPDMSIYKHILVLRQHGASVKYGQQARADCLRNYLPRQGPILQPRDGPISVTDIMNPNRDDLEAIDCALANVINTGGEVEFGALPHGQSGGQFACRACTRVFSQSQDRDDHIGGGRIKCTVLSCGVYLPCQGLMDDHMDKIHPKHRNRDSDSFPYPNRSSYGSSQDGHNPHNYTRV
ncbi:hypothetical protein LTR84_000696 [Exophiala bonariae]|uniref:C2H2-type domain-containing protein n=1 Tax=Exophiala bonariae TaxID=1690606 RepID=A0AAV9NU27_9EURO|nr:hypothetical protein LTR84_000696 [Exophiala bonariae]